MDRLTHKKWWLCEIYITLCIFNVTILLNYIWCAIYLTSFAFFTTASLAKKANEMKNVKEKKENWMKKQKFYVFVVMYFTKILGVAHYFLFGIWFDSCAYVSYFQKLIFCWKRQQIKHILSVQVWYCMWNCKINNKMLRWLYHTSFLIVPICWIIEKYLLLLSSSMGC